jgi:hypothetical protein
MHTFKPGRGLAVFALLVVLAAGCSALTPAPTVVPPTLTAAPPPTSASDNPTAGAIRLATRQAQATRSRLATDAPLASQTAAAAASATQAAAALDAATATAAIRATVQALYNAENSWPEPVHESFADNQLGWPLGVTQDQYLAVTSTVAGGSYQWLATIASSGAYTNLVPARGPSLGDFYAGVTVTFAQGNDNGQSDYGLAFRLAGEDFGFFGIGKTGGFTILEVHGSNIDQQISLNSSLINTGPGAANKLGVVGTGSDFNFLINDQPVADLAANLAPGQIGLGVEAFAPTPLSQVNFTNFEVRAP